MKPWIVLSLAGSMLLGSGCAREVSQRDKQDQDLRDQQAGRDVADRGDDPEAEDAIGIKALTIVGGVLAGPFVGVAHLAQHLAQRSPGLAARQMDDPNGSADGRRTGLSELACKYDFTHKPPYTTRYKQLAQDDPDVTVRAMAIRSLNISHDTTATPLFIAALEDDNELIRLEAVKALGNIPDPAAIPGLLRRLDGKRSVIVDNRTETREETKDIRIAAAAALRHYPKLDVARSLINELNERDFSVSWQARRTLIFLTGRDLKYDEAAWLTYLTGPEKPFG